MHKCKQNDKIKTLAEFPDQDHILNDYDLMSIFLPPINDPEPSWEIGFEVAGGPMADPNPSEPRPPLPASGWGGEVGNCVDGMVGVEGIELDMLSAARESILLRRKIKKWGK